jgi:hypothetical protein
MLQQQQHHMQEQASVLKTQQRQPTLPCLLSAASWKHWLV